MVIELRELAERNMSSVYRYMIINEIGRNLDEK